MFLNLFIASMLAWVWAPGQAPNPSQQRALLDRYCVSCHTQKNKDRGTVPIALDNADVSNPSADAELWEKVVRKMRGGLMPPPGVSRPDEATAHNFISWLETSMDHAAEARPDPGRPLIHRLNRAEYANVIRDLLSLQIDAAALLPPDDSAYGFDNMAEALG